MTPLRDLPIKRKLTLVIMLASLIVLLLACSALLVHDLLTFRQSLAQDMTVLADIVGRNSTVALTLDVEQGDAQDTLSALVAEQHILAACLYSTDQKKLATYVRSGAAVAVPAAPPPDGYRFGRNDLALAHPVFLDKKRIGTVYLVADLSRLYDRLKSYGLIVGGVVVAAFLVSLGLSYRLQRFISKPVAALADVARIVAERKDYSIRAKKIGADEIGLLTDAMNQMLAEIEAGQKAIQQANQSLKAQAGQITETVDILGSSSKEILELSTRVASRAIETATAVTQTTTTVEEVKQTALVSSQKTRQVSESAQRVAQISQAGKKSTEETAEGMKRIREQMQSIADSMIRLSEQSQTIGGIITTVEDLAQQSNLLAVNAAIEAAKAGEQGRGFAVVAQEVKNLAEQSRQATQQVRTILGDIQKATDAAVFATEQGTKAVGVGVQQSQDAGESIVSLSNSVSEAAQAAAQIAASSQQQLAGMAQVATAMDSIKEASGQNVDSAKQLESAARNLRTLGKRLSELVGRYPGNKPAATPGSDGPAAAQPPGRIAAVFGEEPVVDSSAAE